MTNEQKFTNAEERVKAFHDYCRSHKNGCEDCQLKQFQDDETCVCFAYWLPLEAEEKPEPCPFCGDECYVDDGATPRVVCINKDSCCYQGAIARNKAEAIAAHNRVCRAVETAAKQSVTDCNHLGNAARMREALSRILGITDHLQTRFAIPKFASEEILELKQIAESAISAPPRNCDAFSKDEVLKDEVLKVLDDCSFSKEDTIKWLYDEAKGEVK